MGVGDFVNLGVVTIPQVANHGRGDPGLALTITRRVVRDVTIAEEAGIPHRPLAIAVEITTFKVTRINIGAVEVNAVAALVHAHPANTQHIGIAFVWRTASSHSPGEEPVALELLNPAVIDRDRGLGVDAVIFTFRRSGEAGIAAGKPQTSKCCGSSA